MRPVLSMLILVMAAGLAGCDSRPAGKTEEKGTAAIPTPAPPKKDETQITGKVINVEDSGYPLFTVTIALDGDAGEIDLLANDADLKIAGGMGSLQGKAVAAQYRNIKEADLIDMRVDGVSVLGEDSPGRGAKGMTVTGVLSGADSDTTSDLPDTITVTPPDGAPVQFKYYILPEMVAANGKTVEVLYDVREIREIAFIKPR